jgi:hypothetical protein
MSDIFLFLLLLVFLALALAPFALMRRRHRFALPASPLPRAGLSFQRPIAPISKTAAMQVTIADKPPMFANSPAVLEGEIAPDRLPAS